MTVISTWINLIEDVYAITLQDNIIQKIKHFRTLQNGVHDIRRAKTRKQSLFKNTGNSNYSSGMYRSSKGKRPAIYREGYNTDAPLDDNDHTFINKYEDYLSKKGVITTNGKLDYEEEWNTTRIKSNNSNGINNRKDGLPGYFKWDDYSTYYQSLKNSYK